MTIAPTSAPLARSVAAKGTAAGARVLLGGSVNPNLGGLYYQPTLLAGAPQAVIEIGGHTDAYGAPEYNMDLSRRRAEAVRDYFVKRGLTQRFDAVGYGATKPRSTEQTQAALQRNRRIELHVKGNGDL